MTPHVAILSTEYDVTLVTRGTVEDLSGLLNDHVAFVPLQLERKISITKDVITLLKLWRLLRKGRFDTVYSIMPKSGLLTMLAAKFSGVPLRFHIFTGQVWANKNGTSRLILKLMDRIVTQCATKVLADSPSQRQFLINNNIVNASKIEVLADGSIAGVDMKRFSPSTTKREKIRTEYCIPQDAILFLFVGRLNKDKGVYDLLNTFSKIGHKDQKLHLMIVGPDENNFDNIIISLNERLTGRVHRIGFTDYPENYMAAADVFCLPSYREGFGSSIIEAAAIGLPSVASRIYGIIDAVNENVTGILHEPGDICEISTAMLKLANNPELRHQMGTAAQERVRVCFSQERIAKAFSKFHKQQWALLNKRN